MSETMNATKNRPKLSNLSEKGGSEARRTAAVVLEVLAGGRTPSDAAAALGMSLPRYYAIEAKALGGLVSACEPSPRGKKPSADAAIASLQKDLERSKREAARYQALVRASQRTIGLAPPPPRPKEKGKRRRKPTVRALKAAEVLQSQPPTTPSTGETTETK